ncbi:hypothetical protein [Stenotrophobium rhamnosiphilum]|uniref:Uncharacterized protein n=1 Tax=Stenotrophobium rhamnosiphilum TaxID=2029166 RepID=A0A2T5MDZ0_9GAMM|nr:hypothetical protein [Stenotrophobium rhamnosiphilum]PTU30801.1 hypothetical protein CJD38_10825 [Stenotrophobium rhamnosiphilum]
MEKFKSAKVLTVEPSYEAMRFSKRVSKKPAAVRWPHRRRAMALAIHDDVAEDMASGVWPGFEQFWNEHAVKSGIVLFWAWYGIANWHAIGQILHIV